MARSIEIGKPGVEGSPEAAVVPPRRCRRISRNQHVINERGVTSLMLMVAMALIGIATTAAAKQWKVIVQREREANLLAKGIEIQNALAIYSATVKAGA